jgi:ABC-type antimicrobial peptide transport system permease subunit
LVDIFNKTGINLSKYVKQGFQNLGFNAIVYPVIHIKQIIETSILVIVTAIIGSVYPALKAISLDPAQALHTDV